MMLNNTLCLATHVGVCTFTHIITPWSSSLPGATRIAALALTGTLNSDDVIIKEKLQYKPAE